MTHRHEGRWKVRGIGLGQRVKKALASMDAVAKGFLFIGFSIQLVLGIAWMCCHFARTQDFGEPDSALYRNILGLLGGNSDIMYLVQIAFALFSGHFFLRSVRHRDGQGCRAFEVWELLALLTFPFALQCHMALQPHSFMGSLFLLTLSSLVRSFGRDKGQTRQSGGKAMRGKGWKRVAVFWGLAFACGGLAVALSGVMDADRRSLPGRSFEAAVMRRMAWPTFWGDKDAWPEELRALTDSVVWEASFFPSKAVVLESAVENGADDGAAKEYYGQMARIAWQRHSPMIVRQIGWDVLGYALTPVIFSVQMEGGAYESCTGGNYEAMRGNAPMLTRYYVEYGCWWFGCSLALSLLLTVLRAVSAGGRRWREWLWLAAGCILASGVLIVILVMRGAGLMDYKYTIAVNELWLVWALLLMEGGRTWQVRDWRKGDENGSLINRFAEL